MNQIRRRVSRKPASGKPRFRRYGQAVLEEIERRLGGMLLRFPLIAKQTGHATPKNTIIDYLHEEDIEDLPGREAAAFLIDFLTMKTPDLIKKWYGDDAEPTALVKE
jgi:hypothetical protein